MRRSSSFLSLSLLVAAPALIAAVKQLLIAQGIPQIARHILVLRRTLEESSVEIYVKVGTTGTGGMGLNIPYTHSEDKPSLTLLAKSAIGFAHTGLLFLMARTPGGSEEAHGAMRTSTRISRVGWAVAAALVLTLGGCGLPSTDKLADSFGVGNGKIQGGGQNPRRS